MANRKQPSILRFEKTDFIDLLAKQLVANGKVKVNGLGMFTLKKMPEKRGFNPHTRELQIFPEHTKVTFKPVAKFKKAVQI